jgi:hypothetical protein
MFLCAQKLAKIFQQKNVMSSVSFFCKFFKQTFCDSVKNVAVMMFLKKFLSKSEIIFVRKMCLPGQKLERKFAVGDLF